MMISLLLLIGLASVVAETSKISQKQLSTGEKIFIETSTGRQVLFHGVNAIVKGFPYVPATDNFNVDISLTTKDYEALQSMGMNVIRLGTMWKGAEPKQSLYNETYFDQLRLITQAASKFDIYTILDMHQDVISEVVCGEGVPDWMVDLSSLEGTKDAFPAPLADPYIAVASDGPYPTRQDCSKFNWPSYYNTVANGVAFEQLYDTSNDAWALYWKKVAQELGG
ncbi:hypothetical protein EON63_06315 [archaeon]|nr:MAG: hypothetical protein EON63_06315 [archaeon]